MESRFYNYDSIQSRERDVPYERKQELFLLAGRILLDTDHEKTWITEEEDPLTPFTDTNGEPALRHVLTMDAIRDDKWGALRCIGVMSATLSYQPERRLKDRPRLCDQIDLEIQTFERPPDSYTMKLVPLAMSRSGGYVVKMANNGETERQGYPLLEISGQDASHVSRVLTKADQIVNPQEPGLATP